MRVAINEEMVKKIITLYIISTCEYTASVWNRPLKKRVEKIEKVIQRAATKWMYSLRDFSYEDKT